MCSSTGICSRANCKYVAVLSVDPPAMMVTGCDMVVSPPWSDRDDGGGEDEEEEEKEAAEVVAEDGK
jgi:hypothetical protein